MFGGFVEKIQVLSEKATAVSIFFVPLYCLVGERAHLLLRGCGPPDGRQAWFERYFVSRGPADTVA